MYVCVCTFVSDKDVYSGFSAGHHSLSFLSSCFSVPSCIQCRANRKQEVILNQIINDDNKMTLKTNRFTCKYTHFTLSFCSSF